MKMEKTDLKVWRHLMQASWKDKEGEYWAEKEEQILDGESRKWSSDQLKLTLLDVSDKYLDMSEEELADVTPFDVLNEIYKTL